MHCLLTVRTRKSSGFEAADSHTGLLILGYAHCETSKELFLDVEFRQCVLVNAGMHSQQKP